MNANQVNGILRTVVPALLAYAVAKGWLTDSQVADISAAIITLVMAGWSFVSNREKNKT